jgi:hypothetical protein
MLLAAAMAGSVLEDLLLVVLVEGVVVALVVLVLSQVDLEVRVGRGKLDNRVDLPLEVLVVTELHLDP